MMSHQDSNVYPYSEGKTIINQHVQVDTILVITQVIFVMAFKLTLLDMRYSRDCAVIRRKFKDFFKKRCETFRVMRAFWS